MAYITKAINLPVSNRSTRSGYSRGGSIKYYPPEGITIASWRITVFDVDYVYYAPPYAAGFSCRIQNIKGKFRQYDASDNLLSEVDVNVSRGGSQTITASSGVDHVELLITYFENYRVEINYSNNLPNPDNIFNGTGSEIIRIASLDGAGNETSSLRITSYKAISPAKDYEEVQVISENPVREFSITTTNTNPYIVEWYITVDSVVGTTDPNVDKVNVELLDENKNTLNSILIPAVVGSSGYLTHNTNTKYIRVSLLTTKRIIVTTKVNEAISLTYGIS
jgi:hypothetical protein